MHFNPQSNIMPGTSSGDAMTRTETAAERAPRGGLQAGVVTLVCGVGITIGVWIWRESGGPQKVMATLDSIDETNPAGADGEHARFDAAAPATGGPQDTAASEMLVEAAKNERTVEHRQARSRQLYQSARSHMNFGRHDDAMPYLREAIELDPNFAYARYQLGLAHVMTGSIDAARDDHAKLSLLDPSLANLLGNLIRSQ